MDNGSATPLKNQPAVPDQSAIGQPADAMGYEIGSKTVGVSLNDKGNVNQNGANKKMGGGAV